MTKTELQTYRDILLTLGQRLNGDVFHLADEALRAMQRQLQRVA